VFELMVPGTRIDWAGRVKLKQVIQFRLQASLVGGPKTSTSCGPGSRDTARAATRMEAHAPLAALFLVFIWIWHDACDPVEQAMFL
jgi:hypothetical protein